MRLAIFDLDGTILHGNSWQEYFWWAVRRWPRAAPGLLARLAARRAGLITPRALRDSALRPLRGRRLEEVRAIGRTVVEVRLRQKIKRAARAEIARVCAEGAVPVLATGAFDFLADPVAIDLGLHEVVCTILEYRGSVCCGGIQGEETRGPAKAAAIQARFEKFGVDWAGSKAYSDDVEDAPLWALVGDPVLVRSHGARGIAEPAGVRVLDWPND